MAGLPGVGGRLSHLFFAGSIFCRKIIGGGLGSTANVKFLTDASQMIANSPDSDIRPVRVIFCSKVLL